MLSCACFQAGDGFNLPLAKAVIICCCFFLTATPGGSLAPSAVTAQQPIQNKTKHRTTRNLPFGHPSLVTSCAVPGEESPTSLVHLNHSLRSRNPQSPREIKKPVFTATITIASQLTLPPQAFNAKKTPHTFLSSLSASTSLLCLCIYSPGNNDWMIEWP